MFRATGRTVSLPATREIPNDDISPSERLTRSFRPVRGQASVTALAFALDVADKVVGKPHNNLDFDTITVPQAGNIEIRVVDPNGRVAASKRVDPSTVSAHSGPSAGDNFTLKFEVPAQLERQDWRVQLINVGEATVRALATVRFFDARHATFETVIPLDVLNHAFNVFLNALRLKVRLDKDDSFIDFSPELKSTVGVDKIRFDAPDLPGPADLNDVNLASIRVRALAQDNGRATIEMAYAFETDGNELSTPGPDFLDIGDIFGTIELTIGSPTNPRANRVTTLAKFSTNASFTTAINVLSELVTGSSARERVESKVNAGLADSALRGALSEFFTRGLMTIAQRGHQFLKITADQAQDAFIVEHFSNRRLPGQVELDTSTVSTGTATMAGVGAGAPAAAPGSAVASMDFIIASETPRPPTTSIVLRDEDLEGLENLDRVRHIVVLMMENRSFDHMLGYLQPLREQPGAPGMVVDGLDGTETNQIPGKLADRVNRLTTTQLPFSPNHHHGDDRGSNGLLQLGVVSQINGGKMDRFLESFNRLFPSALDEVGMGRYLGEDIPVIDFLARNFAICDRWFCSHPGPTWPNRFCFLSGQAPELENFSVDDERIGYVKLRNLFDVLTQHGIEWRDFEHDFSFSRFYDRYRLEAERVIPFGDPTRGFAATAANGLPPVTVINPAYVGLTPSDQANDDHPPADLAKGQQLICDVYNALLASPSWPSTLFIVTYDEHGGFFDHVAPPGTPEFERHPHDPNGPDVVTVPKIHPDGETFLGPRVPTLLISPLVSAGSVSRKIFDHGSIAKTIFATFLRDRLDRIDLGERVAQANHLGTALDNAASPRLDAPPCPLRPSPSTTAPDLGDFGSPDERRDFHAVLSQFRRAVLR